MTTAAKGVNAYTFSEAEAMNAHAVAASRRRAGYAKREAKKNPRPHWLDMNADDFVKWLEEQGK